MGLVALAPFAVAAPANYARQESSSVAAGPATITESAVSGTAVAPAAAAATLSDVDILNLYVALYAFARNRF